MRLTVLFLFVFIAGTASADMTLAPLPQGCVDKLQKLVIDLTSPTATITEMKTRDIVVPGLPQDFNPRDVSDFRYKGGRIDSPRQFLTLKIQGGASDPSAKWEVFLDAEEDGLCTVNFIKIVAVSEGQSTKKMTSEEMNDLERNAAIRVLETGYGQDKWTKAVGAVGEAIYESYPPLYVGTVFCAARGAIPHMYQVRMTQNRSFLSIENTRSGVSNH